MYSKVPQYLERFIILFFIYWYLYYFFCHQNENEFRRQLKVVRSQQMGFLSAASMESGSYQRGYEHIVRYTMIIYSK